MISWTVLSFLASSFATFSKASFILSKVHSETFTSFLKSVLIFFPLSTFQGEKALLHHSVRAISVIAAFHLLQGTQLPLTLYSCLPFFFSLSKPFYSCSFLGKNMHLFPSPSTAFHDEPFFLCKLMPLPLCQWFVTCCLQRLVVTLLT